MSTTADGGGGVLRRFAARARRRVGGRLAWFVLGAVVMVVPLIVHRLVIAPDPPLERGEILLLSGADDSVGGQRQKLIDEWNRRHPDSPARIISISEDADKQHSDMVSRAQAPGSNIDVYNLDITWIPEFAAADFIRPLDDSAKTTAGFIPETVDTGRFRDSLWALPFNTDAGLLFYRTDLLPGGELPRQLPPPEDEVAELAGRDDALQASYAGQLAAYEGLIVNALEAIWAAGGEVLDEDGSVVVDSEAAQAGLRRLARKAASGALPAVHPEAENFREGESAEVFGAGEVALMRNWPVWYARLKDGEGSKVADRFDVAPLPGPSALGGQSLAIASDTTQPRAARALIDFLTSESSQVALMRDGGFAATRDAVYQDPDVIRMRPYAQTLKAAVKKAKSRPKTPYYPLFSSEFQQILREALAQGGKLPDDAKARLTDALNGKLRPAG